jgi:hypothetical protein
MNVFLKIIETTKRLFSKVQQDSSSGHTSIPKASTQEPTKTEEPPKSEEAESKPTGWVGPYTQHLRKRRNNVLFPENRRHVTAQEWEDAALYDSARIKAHRDKFSQIMAERLVGTGRFSPEAIKNKTDNQIFLHFYENLKQFDALIQEYVFLQGTSLVESEDANNPPDWDFQEDTFLRDCYLNFRNDLEEKMRQTTLQYFNDDAIRAFAESREATHKTSFEISHFHQVIKNNCHFMKDEDLYPRLFSESDSTFKCYIQYYQQSENSEALMKELQKNFLICFERGKEVVNKMPVGNDEPAVGQVFRNMRYLSGLPSRGQILGLLNEDGSYSRPYEELTEIIKS